MKQHKNLDLDHPLQWLLMLRFPDLVALGIVRNRVTLNRWIAADHFPKPIQLGPNSVAWKASEVKAWLDRRAAAPKPEWREA